MKKVLSVLLIIAMVLSLASCGTQTVTRGKFTLKIKGSGSKKLQITIADTLGDYASRTFNLPEDNVMNIAVAEKTKDHSVTYTITAQNPGSTSAYVEYDVDEEYPEYVSFQLYADEKGKLSCDNFYFGNDRKYKEKENPDEEYEISEYESDTLAIRLANGKGTWQVASYDTLIEVIGNELSDEYTEITMHALTEGEGVIQLTNRKEEIQYYFNLKSEMQSDGSLLLSIVSAERSEFTYQDNKEHREKREEAKEEAKEVIEDYYIPDWAYVADLIKYNSKNNSEINVSPKNGTPDTIDATLESRTALYDYVVSKGINYNEKIKEFVQFGIKTEKDLTLGSYTVHYMFINSGFAVAVWKYGDYVSVLTVMEPNTDAECEQAVRDFFS